MTIPQMDGRTVTLVVSSIGSQGVDRFSARNIKDAAALVAVIYLAGEIDVPAARVMSSFGLTAAEAKIALALATGASVPEAAANLGLSANTVKTHLRKVFAKTGTSRQAELVRVLSLLGLLQI
jgi:DNA-binding CsgD family transcriptional regulator